MCICVLAWCVLPYMACFAIAVHGISHRAFLFFGKISDYATARLVTANTLQGGGLVEIAVPRYRISHHTLFSIFARVCTTCTTPLSELCKRPFFIPSQCGLTRSLHSASASPVCVTRPEKMALQQPVARVGPGCKHGQQLDATENARSFLSK